MSDVRMKEAKERLEAAPACAIDEALFGLLEWYFYPWWWPATEPAVRLLQWLAEKEDAPL